MCSGFFCRKNSQTTLNLRMKARILSALKPILRKQTRTVQRKMIRPMSAVKRIVFQNCIFSKPVTSFTATNRTAYPYCFSFHKHSNINCLSIGLSCLAFRIGKSWFTPCNVIVRQFGFCASSLREAFISFTSLLPQIANMGIVTA